MMPRRTKKEQKFGGMWTIEKLNILADYLNAYQEALKNQPFDKIYIDAFAGTGNVDIKIEDRLLNIEGSVRLALNASPSFKRYLFIEMNKGFADKLRDMVNSEYPHVADKVEIIESDCNAALMDICQNTDWFRNRALIFLDPYAMDVNWSTLEAIANTKAMDMWYLFPISATNRLLKTDGQIPDSWRMKLNEIFGNTNWFDEMYTPDLQLTLFGENNDRFHKTVNFVSLNDYIRSRLKTVFSNVAANPRVLHNANRSPLFLFCFAIANDSPKAQGLALKLANHILKKEY